MTSALLPSQAFPCLGCPASGLAGANARIGGDAAPDTEAIGRVATPVAPVAPSTRCDEVYTLFEANPDLLAVPVVADRRPVGLVARSPFLVALASHYGRAVWARKPITVLMDPNPIVVAHDLHIEALAAHLGTRDPGDLMKGLVVTRHGAYYGTATAVGLLQLNHERTRRRNAELETARHSADAANRAKSAFLANMSHELRTPLNAIIGFSELILAETRGPIGNPRYAEYVGDIRASGLHLLGIINGILDMAKIDAGRMNLEAEPVDVAEAIDFAARLIAPQAEASGVSLEAACAPDLPQVRADPRALRQMTLNLLSNAIKFTPRGGAVRIVARRTDPGEIVLAVTDTGIGMTDDQLAVALTPFGQAHQGRHAAGGTGLGLPLTRAFAELQRARFGIRSTQGVGTEVTITFPAEAALGDTAARASCEASAA